MKIHFYDVNPSEAEQLKAKLDALDGNHQTILDQPALDEQTVDPEAEVVAVFVSSHVSAELIAKMPKLRLMACRSTGFDNIDLAACQKHGIVVVNVPTYGENTVAEYAFGLLLNLTRKIPQAMAELQTGAKDQAALQGRDLKGKTLGVVGAGRIGCHMAAIGNGFGMTVVAYDAKPDTDRAKQYGFSYLSLDEVLAQSDVVTLHVPNLASTKHLINQDKLKLMKPTAILINTSRGEVVETEALINALQDGRLAGAALDVFEGEALASIDEELRFLRAEHIDRSVLEESLEFDVLRRLPNVIMTNHNAFNTVEAIDRINQTTVENIQAWLAKQPQNVVKA